MIRLIEHNLQQQPPPTISVEKLKDAYSKLPILRTKTYGNGQKMFTLYTAGVLVVSFFAISTQEVFSIFIPYPQPTEHPIIRVGKETKKFLSDLAQMNMNAQVIRKIKRQPTFSVDGVMVALDGDNIQIFEYPDETIANQEAQDLIANHQTPRWEHAWAPPIRLYQKDTLLVYYLGNHENIANILYETLRSPNVTTLDR